MEKSKKSAQTGERVLKVDKLFTEGVILDSTDEIERSLMHREYHQAGEMVCRIVRRNDQLHSGESLRRGKWLENAGTEKVENIISFVGERGMGKTSVMRSFIEFLTYENTGRESVKSLLKTEEGRDLLDRVYFVPLRFIDASVLKSSEDVMEIILARMFRYVRELIAEPSGVNAGLADREETRALFRQFEQVYRAVMTLNEKSRFEPEESALLRLQSLNSSFSLADSFRKLVGSFLQFTAESRSGFHRGYDSYARTPYLVIALDDVDRYMPDPVKGEPRKGVYTLLGQIDEYLKIPGVIVLTAYDDALLKINCRAYIKEKYQFNDADAENNQVEQYLTKIIPARQKIYMPNLAWKDCSEQDRLQIEIERGSRNQPFPKGKKKKNGPWKLPAKEFTLCYLAGQYGCFFDAAGQKKHFFEEQNLRKLTDLVLAVQLTDKEKREGKGYSKLLSYVCNHFRSAALTGQEAALFSEWMEKPIDRRSRDIISYIRSQRARGGRELIDWGKNGEEWRYSYGELLHSLYQSTRSEGGEEPVFSKKMAQCILASYSVVLPRLVEKQDIELLKRVMGSSIAGRWANSVLPKVTVVKREKDKNETKDSKGNMTFPSSMEAGAYDFKRNLNTYVRISCDSVEKIRQSYQDYTESSVEADKVKKKRELIENIKYLIPAVELFSMFFTDLQKGNTPCRYGWKWKTELGDGRNKGNKFILETAADSACFNIFNFAVNSFAPEVFFEDMERSLRSLVGEWIKDKKEAERLVAQNSLKQEYERWKGKYGRIAMPFQHFDMMYNIMKRQKNKGDNRSDQEMEPQDFLKQCKEAYQRISETLREQDDFYAECLEIKETSKFQKIYDDCPFIRYVCLAWHEEGAHSKEDAKMQAVRGRLSELLIPFLNNLVGTNGRQLSWLEGS